MLRILTFLLPVVLWELERVNQAWQVYEQLKSCFEDAAGRHANTTPSQLTLSKTLSYCLRLSLASNPLYPVYC